MHNGHGNVFGWVCQVFGAAITFVADHGVGVAIMLFGAWVQWETLQLRKRETEARIRAITKPPGA